MMMSGAEEDEEGKEELRAELRKSTKLVPIEDFINMIQDESRQTLVSIR
jgi:hypothetical protein